MTNGRLFFRLALGGARLGHLACGPSQGEFLQEYRKYFKEIQHSMAGK
jgi:hypothetical protein